MKSYKICRVDELPEGGTRRVVVGGAAICLYRLASGVHATQDICSHGNGRLSEGYVLDDLIECPLHQGLFEIATGKAVGAPCTIDLVTYPVYVVGDELEVAVGEVREAG